MKRILIIFTTIFLAVLLPATFLQASANMSFCPEKGADEFFFPKDSLFAGRPDMDSMMRNWYSKHLYAMNEPSLSCVKSKIDLAYRFIWLRTFNHPMAVRVTSSKGQVKLCAVELNGEGGYEPGKVFRRKEKILTTKEWDSLAQGITSSSFWTMPITNKRNGLDGAEWIIEGRQGKNYHVVNRWSPSEGDFRSLGILFMKLSGWNYPEDEVY